MQLPQTLIFLTIVGAAAALGQPSINAGGVVNAASYSAQGLPNSSIAQGSMFLIFGKNLGPATLQQVSSYPLTGTLGGTSVNVTVNGTTVPAIMIYTFASQVAAVLPSRTPTGTGTLTLTYNGQTSNTVSITVIPSSFGTFAVNQAGSGPGIITDAKFNVIAFDAPAKPGDTDIIWGTGLGPVTGDEAAAPLPGDRTNIPVEVYVGLQPASISYRGRSGCCTGLDQIAFVVPSGVQGCYVPVTVKINDVVSNFTTMAISNNGSACSDANGFSPIDLQKLSGKDTFSLGDISFLRTTTQSLLAGATTSTTSDLASASFFRYPTSQLTALSTAGFTSIGTCVVSLFSGMSARTVNPLNPQGLDAGPSITVTGPNGPKVLTKSSVLTGSYIATLASSPEPLYLDPGTYTFSNGSGGADVGPFSGASITLPPNVTWTNMSQISNIPRAQPLTVNWTGGDPAQFVAITGSSNQISGTGQVSLAFGGVFSCIAPVSAGTFTVPPVVLLSLPPSTVISAPGGFSISTGSLQLSSSSKPTLFTANGLDYASIGSSVGSSKSVAYQ